MSETIALKDYFGIELAVRLSNLIQPLNPEFPTDSFVEAVASKVGPLELKKRVAVISDELNKALPNHYEEAMNILLQILGPESETEQGMFNNGYFLMPVAHFVEMYGSWGYKPWAD